MTDPCAARLAARFIPAVSYDQLAHIPHKYRVKYRVKYPLLPYLVPGKVAFRAPHECGCVFMCVEVFGNSIVAGGVILIV